MLLWNGASMRVDSSCTVPHRCQTFAEVFGISLDHRKKKVTLFTSWHRHVLHAILHMVIRQRTHHGCVYETMVTNSMCAGCLSLSSLLLTMRYWGHAHDTCSQYKEMDGGKHFGFTSCQHHKTWQAKLRGCAMLALVHMLSHFLVHCGVPSQLHLNRWTHVMPELSLAGCIGISK